MTSLFDIALDGQRLSSLDSCIAVADVRTEKGLRFTTVPVAGRPGQRVLQRVREQVTVTVRFELHTPSPAHRQAVLDRVTAWCAGRVLTLPYLLGRQLRVVCTGWPQASAAGWTEVLTAAFTAYEVPFWEDDQPTTAASAGAQAQLLLNLPGTAETPLEAAITNRSGDLCRSLCIAAQGQRFAFKNLDLASGECLDIAHDDAGRLTLTVTGEAGTRSVYGTRTAQSDDEVLLHPGRNEIECTADCALEWRVKARGRWL